ncbi:MAG: glycosyltransferase, partial [Clostridia bacterium]|nr:glycosyltransferase [Clostridia bacterium]
QTEFINNIYDFFDLADIVICRAGSNSIFELLALKKLMILIPLAKQSRGEQVDNAKVFQNNGYAKVILEQDLNIQSLKRIIKHSLENREKIQNIMSNYKPMNTNRIILDYVLKYSKKS